VACQRGDVAAGSEATLCLRPEFIHVIAGPAPPAPNLVHGHVASLTFVGEAYETEIRVGDALLLARVDPDLGVAVGDAVHFKLDPSHCLLVAA
jgi:iron(III) transport system ATP-binding protein